MTSLLETTLRLAIGRLARALGAALPYLRHDPRSCVPGVACACGLEAVQEESRRALHACEHMGRRFP